MPVLANLRGAYAILISWDFYGFKSTLKCLPVILNAVLKFLGKPKFQGVRYT
ncbi:MULTISPECIES: hypothetical protein [Methanobacterium]|uniref:hypothetical protein n=1 Tax=Methanobacterium TaxID=2160 RepID=UPI00159F24BD|nr:MULTISPECIES: hypothetical protein [Methanobacterium]